MLWNIPDNKDSETLDDFQDMINLANGERSAMTTLILPHAIAPPDDEYMRSNVRVPGTLRRGLQFCNFWSRSFAQGSHFKLQTRQQVAQAPETMGVHQTLIGSHGTPLSSPQEPLSEIGQLTILTVHPKHISVAAL